MELASGMMAGPRVISRRAWFCLLVFMFVAMLSYTDRQIINVLVDPLKIALRISDTKIGLLQGPAFAIVYAIGGLPFGVAADRLSRKLVLSCGIALWIAGTIGCAAAQGFTSFFIARMMVGLGEASLGPSVISMISDLLPEQARGRGISAVLMGMIAGGAAALILGGALLGLFQRHPDHWLLFGMAPWRVIIAAAALPGPLLIAAILIGVPEPRRRETATGKGQRPSPLTLIRRYAPAFLPLCLGLGAVKLSETAATSWGPSLFIRSYGFAPDRVGATLGGIALASGIAAALIGGWAMDRLSTAGRGSRGFALVAVLAAVASCTSLFGLASTNAALALLALLYLSTALVGAVGIMVVQAALPNEVRGMGIALVSFFDIIFGVTLGSSLVPLATDKLFHGGDQVGRSIALVGGGASLVATLLFIVAWRFRPRPRHDAALVA